MHFGDDGLVWVLGNPIRSIHESNSCRRRKCGRHCANVLATREVANDVVLLDIKEGFAEGKALDIWETAPINLYDTRTVGRPTTTARPPVLTWWGSQVVCHAPGMSDDDCHERWHREDGHGERHEAQPRGFWTVSNFDVMTYWRTSQRRWTQACVWHGGHPRHSARAFLAEELNVSPKDIGRC